jgi:hypothetical protein
MKEIRDQSGRLLATLKEWPGGAVLLDANGDVLGGWNEASGIVRDATGKYIATGPLSALAVLIPKAAARGRGLNGVARL